MLSVTKIFGQTLTSVVVRIVWCVDNRFMAVTFASEMPGAEKTRNLKQKREGVQGQVRVQLVSGSHVGSNL